MSVGDFVAYFVAYAVQSLLCLSLLAMITIGAGFLVLPLLYIVQSKRARREPLQFVDRAADDADLPPVLVQLPVFNEPDVVAGLLDCVSALDWPRNRLSIQLLDDSSDHTTDIARDRIEQLCREGVRIEHVCRDHREGFKAEALTAGIGRSTAPFVAILDADFRPPSNWLRALMPVLLADAHAGFIQSRCEFANANSNWLTRVQGLLFDTHFVMEQAVRAQAGLVFQFNGTAAVWRRRAIEEAGGWSGDCLCEDLDLTVRAALAGWHGCFLSDPVVAGLVPDRVDTWRVQQRRWSMGFAQTARKLLGPVWRSSWPIAQKLSTTHLLLHQAFLPATVLSILSGLVALALSGGINPLALDLTGIVAALIPLAAISLTLPPYLRLKRGGFAQYLQTLATLPPMIVALAFSNVEPFLAALLGRTDIFHRTPKVEAIVLQQDAVSSGAETA